MLEQSVWTAEHEARVMNMWHGACQRYQASLEQGVEPHWAKTHLLIGELEATKIAPRDQLRELEVAAFAASQTVKVG